MEQHSRTEHLEKSLDRMLHWIAAADAKVAPVLAIDTAMLGVLAALLPPYVIRESWVFAAASTAFLLLTISLILLFLSMFPRISGPKGSLVYFGRITDRDETAFTEELFRRSEEEYAMDLALQCYRNAQIAGIKFNHLRLSTTSMFVGLIPWLITIYLLTANAPISP